MNKGNHSVISAHCVVLLVSRFNG